MYITEHYFYEKQGLLTFLRAILIVKLEQLFIFLLAN